jgi:uncharacterized protein (TIGR03066 family)
MLTVRWCLAALAAICFFPTVTPAATPQELIVGKWHTVEKVGEDQIGVSIEFFKDGTLKGELFLPKDSGKVEVSGKYRFLDDNTLEREVTFMGQTHREKVTATVTKEKYVETDAAGKQTEYVRVK